MTGLHVHHLAAAIGIASSVLLQDAAGQCPHEWSRDFGVPGVILAKEGTVAASIVFDDGTGPALYIGGRITAVDGVTTHGAAKWDGTEWTAVNSGLAANAYVRALAIHDDGTGPALYAAGNALISEGTLRARVVKLTSSGWVPAQGVAGGVSGTVNAIASFDADGPGGAPAVLVATGTFTQAAGAPALRLASWDGTAWSALGAGIPDSKKMPVEGRTLGVFDEDGDGPMPARLFIGGTFPAVGDIQAFGIARWDGEAFSTVGPGIPEFSTILCMTSFDDGAGPSLIVAGYMGTIPARRWDGKTWSIVDKSSAGAVFVLDMETFDADGAGPGPAELVLAGQFNYIGGSFGIDNIARWDGERFTSLGGGLTGSGDLVQTLATWPGDTTNSLFAGGVFVQADGMPSNRIALWTASIAPADWNDSGTIDSQDFFDFLTDFFDFNADFNGDGMTSSQDFFDFLTVFFKGC